MMRPVLWTFLAMATASALFYSSAVQAQKTSLEVSHGAEARNLPSRGLQNPSGSQEEAVAAGRKLYRAHCAQCHGFNARGQDRGSDLHSASIQNSPPETLFLILRNGRIRKGMPSWSRLPDQRLSQIVAYLKTLR